MFADRALEFFDHGAFQAVDAATGHDQPVGLEVSFVADPDEVRDEAKAALAVLELAEQDVVEARAYAGCFSTISRTRAKLPCEAPTTSLTSAGSWPG